MERTTITRDLSVEAVSLTRVVLTAAATTPDSAEVELTMDDARALTETLGQWLLEVDEQEPRYLLVVHPEANAMVKTRKNGDDVITVEWTPADEEG